MNKVKIQHYVPRFYLENFAFKRGKEHWLYCFDKSDYRTFPVNIKNIGCEKFFYESKDEEQKLEKALSTLEGDSNEVFKKLLKSKSLQYLNWNEKEKIATFIVVQELRTREFREHLRSLGKEMKRVLGGKPLSKALEQELKTIDSKETVRSIHLKLVTDTLSGKLEMVKMILDMKWILFENYTKIPLWTSDQPINRFNPIDNPMGNLGLKSKGIQIFFPLNHRLGISFCDAVEYFTFPDKMTCIKDNIIFNNTLQVRSSTRHIFSNNNDFSLAKKWLDEHPEFKKTYRRRIQANF
jgi:hypothetical protein